MFGLSPFQLSRQYNNTIPSQDMSSRDPDILSNATEEARTCANCRKDADDQQPCTGCARGDTGGSSATTWFCSLHCQSEYELAHKAACRAADCRRTLYRVGRTTQLVFQRCHETLSKILVTRNEKTGKDIYIHQASDKDKQLLPPVGKNETALPSLRQQEETTPSVSRRIQGTRIGARTYGTQLPVYMLVSTFEEAGMVTLMANEC